MQPHSSYPHCLPPKGVFFPTLSSRTHGVYDEPAPSPEPSDAFNLHGEFDPQAIPRQYTLSHDGSNSDSDGDSVISIRLDNRKPRREPRSASFPRSYNPQPSARGPLSPTSDNSTLSGISLSAVGPTTRARRKRLELVGESISHYPASASESDTDYTFGGSDNETELGSWDSHHDKGLAAAGRPRVVKIQVATPIATTPTAATTPTPAKGNHKTLEDKSSPTPTSPKLFNSFALRHIVGMDQTGPLQPGDGDDPALAQQKLALAKHPFAIIQANPIATELPVAGRSQSLLSESPLPARVERMVSFPTDPSSFLSPGAPPRYKLSRSDSEASATSAARQSVALTAAPSIRTVSSHIRSRPGSHHRSHTTTNAMSSRSKPLPQPPLSAPITTYNRHSVQRTSKSLIIPLPVHSPASTYSELRPALVGRAAPGSGATLVTIATTSHCAPSPKPCCFFEFSNDEERPRVRAPLSLAWLARRRSKEQECHHYHYEHKHEHVHTHEYYHYRKRTVSRATVPRHTATGSGESPLSPRTPKCPPRLGPTPSASPAPRVLSLAQPQYILPPSELPARKSKHRPAKLNLADASSSVDEAGFLTAADRLSFTNKVRCKAVVIDDRCRSRTSTTSSDCRSKVITSASMTVQRRRKGEPSLHSFRVAHNPAGSSSSSGSDEEEENLVLEALIEPSAWSYERDGFCMPME